MQQPTYSVTQKFLTHFFEDNISEERKADEVLPVSGDKVNMTRLLAFALFTTTFSKAQSAEGNWKISWEHVSKLNQSNNANFQDE